MLVRVRIVALGPMLQMTYMQRFRTFRIPARIPVGQIDA